MSLMNSIRRLTKAGRIGPRLGRLREGLALDPCSDPFSAVIGLPCNLVPTRFWYSGDVISGFGWIHTRPADVRQAQSVGPFQLVKDQPVDIIVAYTVGQGTDARTSVGEAQRLADFAQRFFDSNFDPTVNVAERPIIIPREFALQQNYPNPFSVNGASGNPATKISFSLPTAAQVKLQVFDVLGREVATLIHGWFAPGSHYVEFTRRGLPSGIYFYKLQAGKQVAIKKMILLQ